MITGSLPTPIFSEPAEDYAVAPNELRCEENPQTKSGVVQWMNFVLDHLGGTSGGATRNCPMGAPIIGSNGNPRPSGHYTGRAWDWMMKASDPEQKARVQLLLDWINANDNEMFRRLGLSYIIWNGQSFSLWTKSWHPTTSYSQHTDHVHFSFGDKGADGQTSFFRWLGNGAPSVEGPPPPPVLPWQKNPPAKNSNISWFLIGLGLGAVAPIGLDYAYRKLAR